MSTRGAVRAEGLVKSFGKTRALDGLDLNIEPGTVCGLLGPDGAGKTTTVRILTTLLKADSGRASISGFDVVKDHPLVRSLVGLSGPGSAVDELLTGRENLHMVSRLSHLHKTQARRRTEELLERFHLGEAADRLAKTYTGGMLRRLDLAACLLVTPAVLFIDEPTTDLDRACRIEVWKMLGELVVSGTTLVLTARHLEEIDLLADRIVLIDHGRVIGECTPSELNLRIGGDRIEAVVRDPGQLAGAVQALARIGGGEPQVSGRHVTVSVVSGMRALVDAVRELDVTGVALDTLGLRRPTVEEVFMSVTRGNP